VNQWRSSGIPENPRAWIIQAAEQGHRPHPAAYGVCGRSKPWANAGAIPAIEPDLDGSEIPDDRLRLIFTCCHPALAPKRSSLTLRNYEASKPTRSPRAFLVPTATMARRLVRAKRKIRDAGFVHRTVARICPNGLSGTHRCLSHLQ
jgi:RNA polymerase sigma-70 factor (ECF subfamily)